MEGVPDNLVPLILITSQPKEERTWVSISRNLLTEKIQNNRLFGFSAWIPWRPQWGGTCWTRDAQWLHQDPCRAVGPQTFSFKSFFGICAPAPRFSKWLFGSGGTPPGCGRTELSFLLRLRRSWFRSSVSQGGVLATQVWSGCSLFLALK